MEVAEAHAERSDIEGVARRLQESMTWAMRPHQLALNDVLRAVPKHSTISGMARLLGCTTGTVRRHLERAETAELVTMRVGLNSAEWELTPRGADRAGVEQPALAAFMMF